MQCYVFCTDQNSRDKSLPEKGILIYYLSCSSRKYQVLSDYLKSLINFTLFLKVILWTKPRFYYFNPNTDFFTFWYQKGVFFWIETIHCVRVEAKKIVADTWSYFNVHWLSIENCVSITTMFTFVLHRQFEVKFWGAQLGNNSLILRFRSLPRVFN